MLPGLSFVPGQQPMPQQGTQNNNAQTTNPVQDAIKLLSFRLPQNVGQSAIAPQSVLAGQNAGFGSQIGSAVAENWLRQLFGGTGMPDMGQQAPTFQTPQMPSIGPASNPFSAPMNPQPLPTSITNAPGVNVDFHQPQPWRNTPQVQPEQSFLNGAIARFGGLPGGGTPGGGFRG